jgi:RNase H-like domain found in reverse transcriptase
LFRVLLKRRHSKSLKKTFSSAPILGIIRDQGELSSITIVRISQWGYCCHSGKKVNSQPALRVLAYASKTLNDTQRNYCVTRLKLTAIIFVLNFKALPPVPAWSQIFDKIGSRRPTVFKNKKVLTGQLARYLDLMAEYTFDIEHRAGKDHANADFLSRLPCEGEGESCLQCHKATKSSKRVQGAGGERGNVKKNPRPRRNKSLSATEDEAAPLHNLKQKACETSGPPQVKSNR